MEAPVLLITFLRPDSTLKILNIIKKNNIKNLFIFNDGPRKNSKDFTQIKKVRDVINNFSFNGNLCKMYEKKNIGLENNIPKALNWVFKKFDRAIILECDCIPDDSFFKFCNLLLELYKDDLRISQISGTNLINNNIFTRRNSDSYFFSNYTPSWGWATWKNRWKNIYDKNMNTWPMTLKENWLNDIFNNAEEINYWKKIFNRRFLKKDRDWDRIWTYINLINNRMSILPSVNLISNIGYDKFAAHKNPKKWNSIKLEKINFPLKHPKIFYIDKTADKFIQSQGFAIPGIMYRLREFFRKKLKKIL